MLRPALVMRAEGMLEELACAQCM